VQEPGRFGDGLVVRERIAGDQQRLRRDAEGEGGARDRLADCLGQTLDRRRHGWMLGRVKGPVSRRGGKRTGQRNRLTRQLRRQDRLSHLTEYDY